MRELVEAQWFQAAMCLVIVSNVCFFGVEVQSLMGMKGEDVPVGYKVVEYTYAIIFLVELLMRLWAYGITSFMCGEFRAWNYVDVVLVSVSVLELALEWLGSETKFAYARAIRIAKATRVFRAMRIMKLFRPLRILVYTIMETFRALLWPMLLLSLIIYVFGVIFTQMASHEMASKTSDDPLPLEQYFGSLMLSTATLFQSVTGGVDWLYVMNTLLQGHAFWTSSFIFYVAVSHLAILNVVAGVVFHVAIESAQHDQEIVVQSHLNMKEKYISQLRGIFKHLDSDCSGCITLQDFEDHLGDADLRAYLSALSLTTDEAWSLFKLLDVHGTSLIDLDEFVSGCLRLRGNARSVDMHMLLYESRWAMNKLSKIMCQLDEVRNQNSRLLVGKVQRLSNGSLSPGSPRIKCTL